MRQSQKQRIQHQMIQTTLAETWKRIQYLADQIPDQINLAEDADARYKVLNLWAIEEEWIVDPELRAEISMIQPTDEES
jgi:hypothetical protein